MLNSITSNFNDTIIYDNDDVKDSTIDINNSTTDSKTYNDNDDKDATMNLIQELKRLAEEETKNLELIKEQKRLEQLNLDEIKRKSTTYPPNIPSDDNNNNNGKDFKCMIPDNVEIKGAISLAIKLGVVSDSSLDGLFFGSFNQLIGLKKETRQVIIKESLYNRHRDVSHEADIYQYLLENNSNNGCIDLYGYNKNCNPSFIVLEYFGEDLRNYIHSDVDHDTKRLILKKCIEALCCLHNMNVMHGDLKPANILVKQSRNISIKLCDLDSARILTNDDIFPYDQSSGILKYTESWVAPEVYHNSNDHAGGTFKGSLAIDVFNLGIIAILLESKGGYTSGILLP